MRIIEEVRSSPYGYVTITLPKTERIENTVREILAKGRPTPSVYFRVQDSTIAITGLPNHGMGYFIVQFGQTYPVRSAPDWDETPYLVAGDLLNALSETSLEKDTTPLKESGDKPCCRVWRIVCGEMNDGGEDHIFYVYVDETTRSPLEMVNRPPKGELVIEEIGEGAHDRALEEARQMAKKDGCEGSGVIDYWHLGMI